MTADTLTGLYITVLIAMVGALLAWVRGTDVRRLETLEENTKNLAAQIDDVALETRHNLTEATNRLSAKIDAHHQEIMRILLESKR